MLSHNNIHRIGHKTFKGLANLALLDLTHNKIGGVALSYFTPLQNLTTLRLGGNKIRVFKSDQSSSERLASMRNLDLRDNKCDYVHENVFTSMVSLEILHMERNSLSYLFTGRYGKQIFTGLNNLKELFITDNNVESISDSLLKDQINLKVLKMDRNKISGWGPNMFRFTKNLKKLDISHNQILFLDKDRLQHLNQLEEINFRDNPFACNCYLLWFREWIDRTSVQLAYKETYKCRSPEEWRGKQLMTFSRDKINCEDLSKYIIVGSVSGTLLVSVLTVTFLYRSRWRLRLRIYLISKRGKLFLRMLKAHARMGNNYGAINGNQGLYDAYISSSEYDNDWVRLHLLPGIDDGKYHDDTMFGGDFKLYYDPRDFDPGE